MKVGRRTISSFSRSVAAASPGGSPTARAGTRAPNGRPRASLLAWSSNARNGRDMDLYVLPPRDPHFVRRFKEVIRAMDVADWSPDETRVAAVEYLDQRVVYPHH